MSEILLRKSPRNRRMLVFLDPKEKRELGEAFLEQLKNFVNQLGQASCEHLAPLTSFRLNFLNTISKLTCLQSILHTLEGFLSDKMQGRFKNFEALIKGFVCTFSRDREIIISSYWHLTSQDKQVLKKFKEPNSNNVQGTLEDYGNQVRDAMNM